MEECSICEASRVPEALQQLYENYRNSLPDCKQAFAAPTLPPPLLTASGLVCFQGHEPVAALLWRISGAPAHVVMTEFYVESSSVERKPVEMLFERYLARTWQARIRYFELWTPADAKIHQILAQHGFERIDRQLLALTNPAAAGPAGKDIQLVRLMNFDLVPAGFANLADIFYRAYPGTVDGEFYEYYRTPADCQAYLSHIIGSPYCDLKNSWIARSVEDDRVAGVALCYIWPRVRALYLEQLAVHPNYRGRGLGRALLARVSGSLNDGATQNVILTVSMSNRVARGLYLSAGACVLDTERAYVKRNANAPSAPLTHPQNVTRAI